MNKIKFTLYQAREATVDDIRDGFAHLSEYGEEIDVEEEKELPAKWEICEECEGNGQICNPSIGAITGEEWERDWDEDEREGYLNGRYDVKCPCCQGGKLLVPDNDACKNEPLKSLLAAYYEQAREKARYDAEDRQTLYGESGGREGSRW